MENNEIVFNRMRKGTTVKSVWREEFKRAFTSTGFVVSLLIGIFLVLWDAFTDIYQGEFEWIWNPDVGKITNPLYHLYPAGVFHAWSAFNGTNLQMDIISYLFPILVALPFAASLASDRKNGIARNLLCRCSRKTYLSAKYFAAVISGGTAIILPFLLSFLLCCVRYPLLQPLLYKMGYPIDYHYLWGNIYMSNFGLYIFLKFLLLFIYSASFISITFAFSQYLDNVFVIILSPFVVWIFLTTICNYFITVLGIIFLDPRGNALFQGLYLAQDGVNIGLIVLIENLFFISAGTFLYFRKGIKGDMF
jgi:ABC-type transport system involved in multi-copper enzyme maturation permease subunit